MAKELGSIGISRQLGKLHFQFIGTTWTEWEERQRRQNEPIEDVYPNKRPGGRYQERRARRA
jgi:hypothetical protein